jgi:type I restriction enzyme R subunit
MTPWHPETFCFWAGCPPRSPVRVSLAEVIAGYPPDLQEEATKTVLAQAELLCADWAA